jgi:hypothetical protein
MEVSCLATVPGECISNLIFLLIYLEGSLVPPSVYGLVITLGVHA